MESDLIEKPHAPLGTQAPVPTQDRRVRGHTVGSSDTLMGTPPPPEPAAQVGSRTLARPPFCCGARPT